MNKNKELLPYYQKLSKMIEFREGIPYWIVKAANRTVVGSVAGWIAVAGQTKSQKYRKLRTAINGANKTVSAHRLQWFMHYNELPNDIDHIDRNGLNNNIVNLRTCTRSQNCRNITNHRSSASGYVGVYWHAINRKWCAHLRIEGRSYHLGSHLYEYDAAMAYDNACRFYRVADFANLNFPAESNVQNNDN